MAMIVVLPAGTSTGTCTSTVDVLMKLSTGAALPPIVKLATSPALVPMFIPVIKIGAPGDGATVALPAAELTPVIDGVTGGGGGLSTTVNDTVVMALMARVPAVV